MKNYDQIKLHLTRNWKLPGTERLARIFGPSRQFKDNLKNGIIWLTGEDIAIYTTADNYIEWTILSTGAYEEEISKLIRISLKPGGIALDIGANIGLQTIRMSQCVGASGKVISFEPLNHLQAKFKKNMALNKVGNVSLLPFALADEEGEQEFTVEPNEWNQGSFSLADKKAGQETQRVSIRVADQLEEIRSLDHLDLVKIDVEGFEFQVLKGLEKTLAKFKPRIIFEYDRNYWKSAGLEISECIDFLHAFNYTIFGITAAGCQLIGDPEQITAENLLCLQA